MRGFFRVRSDPDPFLAGLANRALERFPFELEGRILDLGCGTGHLSHALDRRGVQIASTDLDRNDLLAGRPPNAFQGDATRLAVRDASFHGVICSNVLEHTPHPHLVFDEIERILEPGGWAWVSWTPWYSPFGGHAIAPLHYLGTERGLRWYRRLIGEPGGKNLPFDGVWPTTITDITAYAHSLRHLTVVDIVPRYYPSQRWIMRLRGVREVVAWNCVILLEKPLLTTNQRTDVNHSTNSQDPR